MSSQQNGPCSAYVFAEDLLDPDSEPSPECLAPIHYAIYREAVRPGDLDGVRLQKLAEKDDLPF